ncbi:glycine reductase [Leptotrichia sp. OH3620_COT-345]|uniref:GrdX family protein n=1 Tax=Leptotrichia sp. OH3620_COT-345 TaxID=2491048 RepID=UPI000F6483A2|nr:GrdX family protein [Leptotrichia sp. OH3620_COT-345]RRD39637.1 glycine reductase [Leptotrichia sp. OH3620_COT-345]
MKLLTNNPKFLNYVNKGIEVDFREVSYLKILEIARDYVHKNYEILTHPMYGSVKPNETLYRSVVLEPKDTLDINSVNLISHAIETFIKFRKNKETPLWQENIKEDFSVIDHDLITNAIERIIK